MFVVLCELVGFSVLPITFSAIPTWYAGLIKPSFSPPNWIFGPVWTVLYAFMGISLYFVVTVKAKKEMKKNAVRFFAMQLFLNFLWSLLFFGAHEPLWALTDLGAMIVAVVITMYFFQKISRMAFYLFIPYFFWSLFAFLLNASIVYLNK